MTGTTRYQTLLEQKKELVFELLRLSNDIDLRDDAPEESADRYVEFVAVREGLIGRLRALDKELGTIAPEETAETAALQKELHTMAGQLIKLEPGIRRKANGLSMHFQRRLNAINARRQEAQSRGEYTKGLRYQKNV